MKRKQFIASMFIGAAAGSLLNSCVEPKNKSNHMDTSLSKDTIVHSVYFWLKEGITPEEEKDFLNFFAILGKIEGIKELKYGKPAPTTPRPVVDNSFSYLLLVTFHNMEEINVYETHPEHLAAIEKYKKYWTKVEVKDAILM
ncbi:Dabb family protein [Sphingobacterium sp. DK4209]|uniref:Dabb family protein n=1 Tax=Sphingobacterium zhuxiongii TaxID=2662364 RepID=A0A5Q0QI23_9SPHI|nr:MULTISPECIES: Dabb family protein [unclassified Sphingobacterium]MVZ64792.1 Dabb family protein [Sphingobacterium sp. DK4209]QGA27120.1 Dabb family protein [Sphingobacterium sp. dk4302]